jgi:hypothetical protein
MRSIIYLFFITVTASFFSQSKKEQIQILSSRLDSLKTLQSSENLSYFKRKTELESSISISDHKTTELSNSILSKKENLQNLIKENQKLDNDILSLKLELKSIEDSIPKILVEQPIKLLEKLNDKKNDEELIKLFNKTVYDVQHDGCNTFEKFSILGKQYYLDGMDTLCAIVMGVICEEKMHPVSGTNFIGLFKFSNSKYSLFLQPIQAIGSFGFGGCAILEGFRIMGKKNLCIILNGGYYGHGISEENRSIFLINKLTMKDVLQVEKHYDDQANEGTSMYENIEKDWEMKFIENQSLYFDLEIMEKSHGKKVKTTILKFNENTMRYE